MKSIEIGTSHLEAFKSKEPFEIRENSHGVWINNVFGINKDGELPARFLTGFISTFTLAQSIQELSEGSIQPKIRIFRPRRISQFINGISDSSAATQIAQGNALLESFAKDHFPDVQFFIEDDQEVSEQAVAVLGKLSDLLDVHCNPEVIQQVKDSGRKRGGEQGEKKALLYVAHHPFGWSDFHDPSIFSIKPAETVINTLPPSERKYTAAREELKKIVPRELKEIVIFGERQEMVINMCGTPHYIFVDDEQGNRAEPTISEVLGVTGGEVLRDMEARFRSEKNTFLKDNLRRSFRDLEKLLLLMSNGDRGVLNESPFESIVKGSGRV